MKCLLGCIALLLTFNSVASAQTADVKQVLWEQGKPCCDEIYIEGVRIRYLKESGVTVALYVLDVDGFYVMAVEVENKTEGRILVDPSQTRLEVLDYHKEPVFLQPLPVEKAARKIAGRAKWGNIFRAFAAGLATRDTTSTTTESGSFSVYSPRGTANGTYQGSAQATTAEPDREVQSRVAAGNARRTADARNEAELARVAALKTTTLFPGHRIDGFIFFEHKNVPAAIFRMMVGQVVYNFRVRIKD